MVSGGVDGVEIDVMKNDTVQIISYNLSSGKLASTLDNIAYSHLTSTSV